MIVTVNGEERDIVPGTSTYGLMASLSVKPELTAVQLNGRVLPKDELRTTMLSEGDVVELVRIVGGG